MLTFPLSGRCELRELRVSCHSENAIFFSTFSLRQFTANIWCYLSPGINCTSQEGCSYRESQSDYDGFCP